MAGLLTHILISLGGFLFSLIIFKEYKYAISFIFGQTIPDAIKFGIPGIMFKTSSFREIISKPLFWQLNSFTHSFGFWCVLCLIGVIISFVLYKMKKIKKSTMITFLLLILVFIISIAIHMVLDAYVIERSYWI